MHRSLINEAPLLVHPKLAQKIGLKEAMILQQIHYWLNPSLNKNRKEGRLWVHNTYDQWKTQFPFWASRTIQRAIYSLERRGLLDSYVTRDFKKTKFYSINYDMLAELDDLQQMDMRKGQKNPANSSTCQSDAFIEPNCRARATLNGTNDQDRVARFYNTEITTETTLHPPQTPPSEDSLRQEEEEDDLFKRMLNVWDETVYQVLNPGKRLHLTKDRKVQMRSLLKGLLAGSEKEWESYCQAVAACPFLMGQNERRFRVTLGWALHPTNALKVLENDFYSQASEEALPVKEVPWDEYEVALKKELQHWPYAEEWIHVCEALVKHLGQVTFSVWFRHMRPKEISCDSVSLLAPNAFIRDYVLQNLGNALKTCVSAVYPMNTSISIDVDANLVMGERSHLYASKTTRIPTKGDYNE